MRKRENDNDDEDVAIIGGIPGVPFEGTKNKKNVDYEKEPVMLHGTSPVASANAFEMEK